MSGWLDWMVDGSVGGGWSDTDLINISIPILIDMLFMNKNRYLYQFIPDVPDILKSPNILDFSYIPYNYLILISIVFLICLLLLENLKH